MKPNADLASVCEGEPKFGIDPSRRLVKVDSGIFNRNADVLYVDHPAPKDECRTEGHLRKRTGSTARPTGSVRCASYHSHSSGSSSTYMNSESAWPSAAMARQNPAIALGGSVGRVYVRGSGRIACPQPGSQGNGCSTPEPSDGQMLNRKPWRASHAHHTVMCPPKAAADVCPPAGIPTDLIKFGREVVEWPVF